jgi:hypothetical protein
MELSQEEPATPVWLEFNRFLQNSGRSIGTMIGPRRVWPKTRPSETQSQQYLAICRTRGDVISFQLPVSMYCSYLHAKASSPRAREFPASVSRGVKGNPRRQEIPSSHGMQDDIKILWPSSGLSENSLSCHRVQREQSRFQKRDSRTKALCGRRTAFQTALRIVSLGFNSHENSVGRFRSFGRCSSPTVWEPSIRLHARVE